MNMINKYKIQLYFLEQLTELRKIKQVTQKKKEAVCQEEKELIRQKNFLVPNPNDSYSRKKFKKNEEILLKSTNGESELSWKDMKMIFDRTPMRDALRMLGKRYNVDFIVNTSKYDKYTFTGMFTDQYVDEILENFKISSCIRWRVIKAKDNDQKKRVIEIY
jgi:hypothetical protein